MFVVLGAYSVSGNSLCSLLAGPAYAASGLSMQIPYSVLKPELQGVAAALLHVLLVLAWWVCVRIVRLDVSILLLLFVHVGKHAVYSVPAVGGLVRSLGRMLVCPCSCVLCFLVVEMCSTCYSVCALT